MHASADTVEQEPQHDGIVHTLATTIEPDAGSEQLAQHSGSNTAEEEDGPHGASASGASAYAKEEKLPEALPSAHREDTDNRAGEIMQPVAIRVRVRVRVRITVSVLETKCIRLRSCPI